MTPITSYQKLSTADKDQAKSLFKISIPDTFQREGIKHLTQTCIDEIDYKCRLIEDALGEKKLGFTFWVAKKEDTVVAIISYGPCGEDIQRCSQGSLSHLGELGSLYVLPEYQNQGLGSALIKAMVTELMSLGIRQFCLDSGYPSAQKRWKQKFGKPVIEVKDYWGPGMTHCVWVSQCEDVLKPNKGLKDRESV
jgi:GNAT superfamily N-acetyltransferase